MTIRRLLGYTGWFLAFVLFVYSVVQIQETGVLMRRVSAARRTLECVKLCNTVEAAADALDACVQRCP